MSTLPINYVSSANEGYQRDIQNAWARGEKVPVEIVQRAFSDNRVMNTGLDSFVQQTPPVIVINNGQQPQIAPQVQQMLPFLQLFSNLLRLQQIQQAQQAQQTQQQMVSLLQLLAELLKQKRAVNSGTTKTDDTAKTYGPETDVKKLDEMFSAADADGKDGVSKEEFVKYMIQDFERVAGKRFTNENDPDLAKIKKQAENLFEALKDPNETNLTKERFDKIVEYYDKASDGKKDGKINAAYMISDIEKIKNEGKDVKISDGKTLEELIA